MEMSGSDGIDGDRISYHSHHSVTHDSTITCRVIIQSSCMLSFKHKHWWMQLAGLVFDNPIPIYKLQVAEICFASHLL